MSEKDEIARKLAEMHYQVEPGITQIFLLRGAPRAEASKREPIKLLEVNEETIPTGIMPLQFGARPDKGVPYPCVTLK